MGTCRSDVQYTTVIKLSVLYALWIFFSIEWLNYKVIVEWRKYLSFARTISLSLCHRYRGNLKFKSIQLPSWPQLQIPLPPFIVLPPSSIRFQSRFHYSESGTRIPLFSGNQQTIATQLSLPLTFEVHLSSILVPFQFTFPKFNASIQPPSGYPGSSFYFHISFHYTSFF